VALYRAKLLRHWVQQNHDGLPQKAGFPQHELNEIHGAWFDPSNPVVPMSGSLRGDLMEWLEEWEEKADLTLALGSSLCGMNADRMVTSIAERAAEGKALGTVIISLQRTQHDDSSALRIFAKIDVVMNMLAKHMQLTVDPHDTPCVIDIPKAAIVQPCIYRVPYDPVTGKKTSNGVTMNWDLRNRAKIILTHGPGAGFEGEIHSSAGQGHYLQAASVDGKLCAKPLPNIVAVFPCIREGDIKHGNKKYMCNYAFGNWWIECATKGQFPRLPFVNMSKP